MTEKVTVEVVFAAPDRQELVSLELEQGVTVTDAIRESRLQELFAQVDFDALEVGIWGRVVERGTVLHDGDRIELYRPLERDPKDARRELARVQRLGSSS